MKKTNLLSDVRAYCRAAGISPSTLGVKALGNSRFFERLERKLAKADEDETKIRDYMAANPAPPTSEGDAA